MTLINHIYIYTIKFLALSQHSSSCALRVSTLVPALDVGFPIAMVDVCPILIFGTHSKPSTVLIYSFNASSSLTSESISTLKKKVYCNFKMTFTIHLPYPPF